MQIPSTEAKRQAWLNVPFRKPKTSTCAASDIKIPGPGGIKISPAMLQLGVGVPYVQLIITKLLSKSVRHVRLDHNTFLKSIHQIPRSDVNQPKKETRR